MHKTKPYTAKDILLNLYKKKKGIWGYQKLTQL